MQQHRLTPEAALLSKEWAEINRLAWVLRRLTGGALRLGLQMRVPEALRNDVIERVEWLQNKHGIKGE